MQDAFYGALWVRLVQMVWLPGHGWAGLRHRWGMRWVRLVKFIWCRHLLPPFGLMSFLVSLPITEGGARFGAGRATAIFRRGVLWGKCGKNLYDLAILM
jgi:hypothetical protein